MSNEKLTTGSHEINSPYPYLAYLIGSSSNIQIVSLNASSSNNKVARGKRTMYTYQMNDGDLSASANQRAKARVSMFRSWFDLLWFGSYCHWQWIKIYKDCHQFLSSSFIVVFCSKLIFDMHQSWNEPVLYIEMESQASLPPSQYSSFFVPSPPPHLVLLLSFASTTKNRIYRMNFTPTLANIMDLNFPHGETGQSNAFSKYILLDTGLIGFLNHKFYGKCHTHTHTITRKTFLLFQQRFVCFGQACTMA